MSLVIGPWSIGSGTAGADRGNQAVHVVATEARSRGGSARAASKGIESTGERLLRTSKSQHQLLQRPSVFDLFQSNLGRRHFCAPRFDHSIAQERGQAAWLEGHGARCG